MLHLQIVHVNVFGLDNRTSVFISSENSNRFTGCVGYKEIICMYRYSPIFDVDSCIFQFKAYFVLCYLYN